MECAIPWDVAASEMFQLQSELGIDQIHLTDECQGDLGYGAVVGKEAEFMKSVARSIEFAKIVKCQKYAVP